MFGASLGPLITGVLLVIFGPIAVKVLERLMGNAPTWVWRVLAFLCIAAGWTIVMLNDPVKQQVKLHPQMFVFLTASMLLVAVLLVRTRFFDPAQSIDLAQRDHIVARLRDFIGEANEPDPGNPLYNVGFRFGVGERVEQFLSLYSTEWIERVNKKGARALDEISAELLNGAPIPPLLGPSSGQAQARFNVEVMRVIASPLIGPDRIVVGSQLFVHLHIVRIGTSSTIRTFGVDIATEKAKYTVERPKDGKLYYPLGFGGDGHEVLNLCTVINWELFQHGQGREGYLSFHLEDTPSPSELSKTIPKYLKGAKAEVWINDALGKKHYSNGVEMETFERGQN